MIKPFYHITIYGIIQLLLSVAVTFWVEQMFYCSFTTDLFGQT